MELENRLILVFTVIGLVALIPFISATYGSQSIYQNSPSGMILNAIEKQPNSSSPHTRNIVAGPDSYNETIQTPYGEFTMSMRHDEIIYQLEGSGKKFTITERAEMRSELLSTSGYTLNKTTTPFQETEELKTSMGSFKAILEDGVFSNSTTCSNSSYIEFILNTARQDMENENEEIEIIMSGMTIPGVSEAGIYINEFMANPGTNGTEWIEIFNNRSSLANIGGWILDDASGGSEPYAIPAGTNISSKGFLVFYDNVTEIQLNNNGDYVRMLDSSGNLIDSFYYQTSTENRSIGRVPDGGSWTNLTLPTPGSTNG